MFEKVNPSHPDKLADRIAGAIVDLAYKIAPDPRIAVEVLIGHDECHIIAETSQSIAYDSVKKAVIRITGQPQILVDYFEVPQDPHLAENQAVEIRCGDNGIFKGIPMTEEEKTLSKLAREIYEQYPSDGKYILDKNKFVICQSNADTKELIEKYPHAIINPLGDWTGGTNVDTGATNRKLGSDMGQSITGGGLHGKDLSKADVSINIYLWLMAQKYNEPFECSCAIGDDMIGFIPYSQMVEATREYIKQIGGFEKLAEWGLI